MQFCAMLCRLKHVLLACPKGVLQQTKPPTAPLAATSMITCLVPPMHVDTALAQLRSVALLYGEPAMLPLLWSANSNTNGHAGGSAAVFGVGVAHSASQPDRQGGSAVGSATGSGEGGAPQSLARSPTFMPQHSLGALTMPQYALP